MKKVVIIIVCLLPLLLNAQNISEDLKFGINPSINTYFTKLCPRINQLQGLTVINKIAKRGIVSVELLHGSIGDTNYTTWQAQNLNYYLFSTNMGINIFKNTFYQNWQLVPSIGISSLITTNKLSNITYMPNSFIKKYTFSKLNATRQVDNFLNLKLELGKSFNTKSLIDLFQINAGLFYLINKEKQHLGVTISLSSSMPVYYKLLSNISNSKKQSKRYNSL
jgi:hypothetical protein